MWHDGPNVELVQVARTRPDQTPDHPGRLHVVAGRSAPEHAAPLGPDQPEPDGHQRFGHPG